MFVACGAGARSSFRVGSKADFGSSDLYLTSALVCLDCCCMEFVAQHRREMEGLATEKGRGKKNRAS